MSIDNNLQDSRCSVVSRELSEPIHGSAPRAQAWLVLEQPGPFGPRAPETSHLPARVGAALTAAGSESGTTVLLARTTGKHPDVHQSTGVRRFWFAHTAPGGVRMRTGHLSDEGDLLRPDLAAVLSAAARGELPPWGHFDLTPLLLVCTNGRRDVCCAIEGRAVAEAVASDGDVGARVLEVSHLGGHRFSPTALLLPWGLSFGRLTTSAAQEVLGAASRQQVPLTSLANIYRGRSCFSQPAQAAEAAVRHWFEVAGIDDIDVLRLVGGRPTPAGLRWEGEDGLAHTHVRHVDGRTWSVDVDRVALTPPRSESCGKIPAEGHSWIAREPAPLQPWR